MTGNSVMDYDSDSCFQLQPKKHGAQSNTLGQPSPKKRQPRQQLFSRPSSGVVAYASMTESNSNSHPVELPRQQFFNMTGCSIMAYDDMVKLDATAEVEATSQIRQQCFYNMTGSSLMSYDESLSLSWDGYQAAVMLDASDDVPLEPSALSMAKETPPPRLTFSRRRRSRGTPRGSSTPLYYAGNSSRIIEEEAAVGGLDAGGDWHKVTAPDSKQLSAESGTGSSEEKKHVSFTARDVMIAEDPKDLAPGITPDLVSCMYCKQHTPRQRQKLDMEKITDSVKLTRQRILVPAGTPSGPPKEFEDKAIQVNIIKEESLADRVVVPCTPIACEKLTPSLPWMKCEYDACLPLKKARNKFHPSDGKLLALQERQLEPPAKSPIMSIPSLRQLLSSMKPKAIGAAAVEAPVVAEPEARAARPAVDRASQGRSPLSPLKAVCHTPSIEAALSPFETYFEHLYRHHRLPKFIEHVAWRYNVLPRGHIELYSNREHLHQREMDLHPSASATSLANPHKAPRCKIDGIQRRFSGILHMPMSIHHRLTTSRSSHHSGSCSLGKKVQQQRRSAESACSSVESGAYANSYPVPAHTESCSPAVKKTQRRQLLKKLSFRKKKRKHGKPPPKKIMPRLEVSDTEPANLSPAALSIGEPDLTQNVPLLPDTGNPLPDNGGHLDEVRPKLPFTPPALLYEISVTEDEKPAGEDCPGVGVAGTYLPAWPDIDMPTPVVHVAGEPVEMGTNPALAALPQEDLDHTCPGLQAPDASTGIEKATAGNEGATGSLGTISTEESATAGSHQPQHWQLLHEILSESFREGVSMSRFLEEIRRYGEDRDRSSGSQHHLVAKPCHPTYESCLGASYGDTEIEMTLQQETGNATMLESSASNLEAKSPKQQALAIDSAGIHGEGTALREGRLSEECSLDGVHGTGDTDDNSWMFHAESASLSSLLAVVEDHASSYYSLTSSELTPSTTPSGSVYETQSLN